MAEHEPDVVVLGSAWPLGELAAAMDRPTLALTHGHEAGLTAAGLGLLVRRSTRHLHAITVISTYTHSRLRRAVGAAVHPLPPGVDTDRFRPDLDGAGFRARHGIGPGDPLVVTVGRLVRRKGQDVLVEAWPCVREQVPGARLLVAGDGPLQRHLERRVERLDLNGSVVLPGTVPADDLPACHAAADVFAMPCRTRLGGLDVEGLGIVYLEAQASGTPVVAGRSGGAPEAVRDGRTGRVVDGRSPPDVADAVVELLGDPDVRSRAGAEGRAFVAAHHAWPVITRRFHALLLELGDADRPRR